MKRMILFISLITIFLVINSCSTAYPEITDAPSVINLNFQSGGYVKWEPIEKASSYNIYMIDKDNKVKLIQTANSNEAFIDYSSVNVAISGIVDGKETYLSGKSKANNSWWTSVSCKKNGDEYNLTWKALPSAEDYLLISAYRSESGMNYNATFDACEYRIKSLTEYSGQANPGSWSNTTINKKYKSLNTTENHAIYTGDYFTSSYKKYIHLFAKVGDTYYCISDKINFD